MTSERTRGASAQVLRGLRSWFDAPPVLRLSELSAQSGQVPSLNGWRAACVLLVLVSHTIGHAGLGSFGVLVFFVISGFLITRLFLAERKRTGGINLGDFYARRVVRLYPAILVYTLVVVAAYLVFTPARFDLQQPGCALLYCENFLVAHDMMALREITMPFAGFWSLSVEEQFYIVFPVLLILALWASRGSTRGLILLGVLASVVPLFLRLSYVWLAPQLLLPQFGQVIYVRTETRIDSIAAGVLIAAACETASGRDILREFTKPLPAVLALTVVMGWPFLSESFFRQTFGYTVQDAAAAALICATVFTSRYRPISWLLNLRITDWIGRLSYSLYVWHFAVLHLVLNVFKIESHLLRFLVVIALTPLVASASYYGPEAWARQWRTARRLPQLAAPAGREA